MAAHIFSAFSLCLSLSSSLLYVYNAVRAFVAAARYVAVTMLPARGRAGEHAVLAVAKGMGVCARAVISRATATAFCS